MKTTYWQKCITMEGLFGTQVIVLISERSTCRLLWFSHKRQAWDELWTCVINGKKYKNSTTNIVKADSIWVIINRTFIKIITRCDNFSSWLTVVFQWLWSTALVASTCISNSVSILNVQSCTWRYPNPIIYRVHEQNAIHTLVYASSYATNGRDVN